MSKSQTYGLIGYPVSHSLSPLMHNAAFKHLGIDAHYHLFEVPAQKLEDFLVNDDSRICDTSGEDFSASSIRGFNITVPHKVSAKEIIDKKYPKLALADTEASFHANLMGAINTVKRESQGLIYTNTDYQGFGRSLDEDLGFDAVDKTVLLLGCGGAARAVIVGLSHKEKEAKKIYVYDPAAGVVTAAQKYFSQIYNFKDRLEFISFDQIPEVIKSCDLLVNASTVGMNDGDGSPIDNSLLHKKLCVYDLVYNRKTQLIEDAKSLGLRTCGGSGMLLYQGVYAFQFWLGKEAPVEVMRDALMKGLKS